MTCEATIFVGDYGHVRSIFVVDENEDPVPLGTAVLLEMRFRPPEGDPVTVEASEGNGDGEMVYTVEESDGIDAAAGKWKVQGIVTFPASEHHTTVHTYYVADLA